MRKISSETNKIIDYSLNETNERANTGSKDLDVRMTSAIQRSANQSDIKIVLNYCEKNLNLIFFNRLMKKKNNLNVQYGQEFPATYSNKFNQRWKCSLYYLIYT